MTAKQGNPTISGPVQYAIVGAGVSGLYTAWRLVCDRQQAGPPPSAAIFEASKRVGGRLLTWLPRGRTGGLRAELGGMRFLEQQELVWNLIQRVGLGGDVIDFQVEGPGLRLLLRGRSTLLRTSDPGRRYMLPDNHKGKPASQLLRQAMLEILTSRGNIPVLKRVGGELPRNREQWDLIKPDLTWDGQPLWHIGLWNLLADARNFEMYQYIRDGFGYYSNAANWNAAEAMQSICLENPDDNPGERIYSNRPGEHGYKTLIQGFGSLPAKLASQVREAGCKIDFDTRLLSFERQGIGGLWTLHLKGPEGIDRTVEAENLVLALPRRSLELLTPSSSFNLDANDSLRNLIQSVTPIPAFKLFLFYETRWWERLGITVGRSVCDLPIRQTYYFAPDSRPAPARAPGSGLLMASYSDAGAVGFWSALIPPQNQQQAESVKSPSFADFVRQLRRKGALQPPPELHEASPEMLRHAKAQLALLHDIPEASIPDPKAGAFAYWGLESTGGGWNLWNPGVRVHDTMKDIKTPLGHQERVYIVGEAYSGVQGWVEGALTATEVTLQKHLKLDPPKEWLPDAYYLGR
jgi:monoamine oxidase